MWPRNNSAPPPRLALAFALSAALHLALIYGVSAPPARSEHLIPVIEARIVPVAGVPQQAALAPRAAPAHEESGATVEPLPEMPSPTPAPVESPAAAVAEPSAQPHEAVAAPQPAAAATLYFTANAADSRARPLAPVEPVYPRQAEARGITGKVVLLLLVDEAGTVSEATAVAADPAGTFEDSALAAFRRARFMPAQKDGKAVKSRLLLQVFYELGNESRQIR